MLFSKVGKPLFEPFEAGICNLRQWYSELGSEVGIVGIGTGEVYLDELGTICEICVAERVVGRVCGRGAGCKIKCEGMHVTF